MNTTDYAPYLSAYRDGLLGDTLPFWLNHGMDREHGGVLTSLNRDGSVLDTDKAVWTQGRCAWLFATLYNTVEPREEWLEAALSCLEFLERHAFDADGRMFFLLTREGKPLRKRRYVFSEAFACMAFSACAKATGRTELADRARSLFDTFTQCSFEAETMTAKVDPVTRPSKGIGPLMICLNLAQELRSSIGFADAESWIDRCIDEIECETEREADNE